MTLTLNHRPLEAHEVETLVQNGCTVEANDWARISVAPEFDPQYVRNTHFGGQVRLGVLGGSTGGQDPRPSEIRNACLIDCTLGDRVRVANIGVHVAGYEIGDGACIEDVGTLSARSDARFGNGVEIEVLNEGGGREVTLFDALSSQFAHLLCLHRYRPKMVDRLQQIAHDAAQQAIGSRGRIGSGAHVRSVAEVVDVHIGPCAIVSGALSLKNGSILSHEQAPTRVGAGVQANDFIIAEGAEVTGAAMISTTYVGQACRIGRQFSAEGSLFFANCEAFHGEACSVFAGPYTVTHHKGSLLIAGMFSFYNAGSGTNQSNHMYKLGPVHEGRLERGSKTGSFSYMMWPCRVGPFSVVLGKHTRTFDTADFPFSHIEAMPDGRCSLVPGFNLTTVGTVRDGAKWPARDRRQGPVKRDRLSFDVFSPYTAGRMLQGTAILKEFQKTTPRTVASVAIGGAEVKRVFLRTGQKYYRRGTLMYLADKVVARVESALDEGRAVNSALATPSEAVYSERWVDIGGQLMPAARLETLASALESGSINDLDALNGELDAIQASYERDEWIWVKEAVRTTLDIDLDRAGPAQLQAIANTLLSSRKEFLDAVLVDATKEFDPLSRVGFGTDGSEDAVEADFRAVRGDYDSNKFIVAMRNEIAALTERVERFKQRVAS